MVAHSSYLNLKIQPLSEIETAVWDTNDIFWNQIAKFRSLTVFRKWNCKFPNPNFLPQPKRKILRRKRHFRKQNGIRKLKRHSKSGSQNYWLQTAFRNWKLKRKICLRRAFGLGNFQLDAVCRPPNRLCSLAVYLLHSTWPSVTWLNTRTWMPATESCQRYVPCVNWRSTAWRIWGRFLVWSVQARGMTLNWFLP